MSCQCWNEIDRVANQMPSDPEDEGWAQGYTKRKTLQGWPPRCYDEGVLRRAHDHRVQLPWADFIIRSVLADPQSQLQRPYLDLPQRSHRQTTTQRRHEAITHLTPQSVRFQTGLMTYETMCVVSAPISIGFKASLNTSDQTSRELRRSSAN